MSSPIKQRNPNPLTQAQVTDYVFAAKVTYTDDHSILATEVNKKISLGPLTAAAKTFTLPQITALNDGAIYGILNDSYYQLTLACNAADHVWNSGDGYGLDMYGKGCMVWVQADYNSGTRPVWDVIMRTGGGKVKVEGLALHEDMGSPQGQYYPGANTNTRWPDKTGTHYATGSGNVYSLPESYSAVGNKGCLEFDGSTGFITYEDSTNWDIFGPDNLNCVLSGYVYLADLTGGMTIISQSDSPYDTNNRWFLYIYATTGNLLFNVVSGASTLASLTDTGTFTAGSWIHIAMVRIGSALGFYKNGVQVAYSALSSTMQRTGSLYIGQNSNSGDYLKGRMQDWHIAYNDTLGLSGAPDAGLTSTYTVPAAPMNLVM